MANLWELLNGLTQQAKDQSDSEIASLALDLARVMKESGEFNNRQLDMWYDYDGHYLEGLIMGVVYYPVI